MKPEESKQGLSSSKEKWKKLYAKKWFFPALYIAFAAFILGIAWWYQADKDKELSSIPAREAMDTVLPVEEMTQEMLSPIPENANAEVTMGYYKEGATTKEKEATLVQYANTYWPHTGIDFARKDGKTFDVQASQSGTVTRVENNPIMGHVVELQHDSGLVTVYQSLDDVKVKEGQSVKKGEILAKAGVNRFEKEAGIHLHFEVRKENQPVDPKEYIQ